MHGFTADVEVSESETVDSVVDLNFVTVGGGEDAEAGAEHAGDVEGAFHYAYYGDVVGFTKGGDEGVLSEGSDEEGVEVLHGFAVVGGVFG